VFLTEKGQEKCRKRKTMEKLLFVERQAKAFFFSRDKKFKGKISP